jgi:beta-N-acetylhexosaminidase
MRSAARLMRSASATDVPPNFMTTVSVPLIGMAANDSRAAPVGGASSVPRVQPEPRRRRLAILVLAVVALGAGVAGAVVGAAHDDDGSGAASNVPSPGRGAPEERVSFLARIVPPPAEKRSQRGPAVPRSVADLARRLPLERKVAQLFLFGFRGTDANADIFGRLRRVDLGGIVVAAANYTDTAQLGALTAEARAAARGKRHVPPWVITSQEGGELNSFFDLPPAALPADMGSAREAGTAAEQSAAALRGLGVNGVLGPVVDVGLESGSALGARLYSDNPDEVAAYADATVTAYRKRHVFSAVTHFPGLGAADQSTEEGPATVGLGLDELRERDLIPFEAAVDAGVPGVIIGHALYPFSDFTVPASLSKQVATDLLRRDLRFKGVAITDDLADPAITVIYTVPDAAVRALRAGADMIYISGGPGDQQAAYVAVLRAVQRGRVPRRRLNEAVGRILLAKQDYDLIAKRARGKG